MAEAQLTPAQRRHLASIERRMRALLDELKDMATEVSDDPRPQLFLEAEERLYAMRECFRYEGEGWRAPRRQEAVILSIYLPGLGSGAW